MTTQQVELIPGRYYSVNGGEQRYMCVLVCRGYDTILHMKLVDRFNIVKITFKYSESNQYEALSGLKIVPWVDTPEVDWSLYSPWIVALAMNNGGCWFQHHSMPSYADQYEVWCTNTHCDVIPPKYAPKFTGHARDSLVIRPGYEV